MTTYLKLDKAVNIMRTDKRVFVLDVVYEFYIGAMASMIVFLLMNLSDNLFFVLKVTTYFWVLLATTEALLNNNYKES